MTSPKIDSAGEAIRAMRVEQGLSVQQLAERIGWDKGRLSKFENNKLALSLPVIEKIARALEMSPAAIVLRCLKVRYPYLAAERSEIGKLLDKLIARLPKLEA